MPLRGHLDSVDHRRVTGWAWDSDAPDQPVSVILSCDGQVLARVLADRYRPDLERAGIGRGCHAFDVSLSPALSPLASHSIAARREEDGVHLSKSPRVLEPAPAFDRATQDAMAQVLSTVADAADLERKLAFVAGPADRLRQMHADAQSGADERRARRKRMWREPGPEAPRRPLPLGRGRW